MKKHYLSFLFLLTFATSFSQCVTTAVNGAFTIIVRRTDGTLYGRGRNDWGQLGDGTTVTNYNTMQQIGGDNDWTDIFSSNNHTLAIKTNGTLWAWGRNNEGQIGNGTTINQLTPMQIGTDTDWIAVGTGDYNSIALKSNGTIWTWGKNEYGQLGNGTLNSSYVPQQVGDDSDWVKIAANGYCNFAIKADGTLWAWGYNGVGQLGVGSSGDIRDIPTQVGTDSDWQTVSGGSTNNLAIKSNGTLWSWGLNTSGEIGLGTTGSFVTMPTQVGIATDWLRVSTSGGVGVALKNNGTLWTWGINVAGQLGDGTTTNRNIPAQVGTDTDWVYIDFQNNRTFAMKSNGLLYGFGISTYNEFGNGATLTNPNPVPIQINCNNLELLEFNNTNEILAYPNPFKNDFILDIQSSSNDDINVQVFDLLGKTIEFRTIKASEVNDKISFGDNYSKGVYTLIVNQGEDKKVIKMVKQ